MAQQKRKAKQVREPSPPQRKEVPELPGRLRGIGDHPGGGNPSWRLSLLDLDHAGSWSWGAADEGSLRNIVSFLASMERLTWTEIRGQTHSGGHRKHKPVAAESLCPEAQRRLRDLRLDDFDELFEFRLGSRLRLWGVLHDGVFYAVWWDPDHKVYPVDPA